MVTMFSLKSNQLFWLFVCLWMNFCNVLIMGEKILKLILSFSECVGSGLVFCTWCQMKDQTPQLLLNVTKNKLLYKGTDRVRAKNKKVRKTNYTGLHYIIFQWVKLFFYQFLFNSCIFTWSFTQVVKLHLTKITA